MLGRYKLMTFILNSQFSFTISSQTSSFDNKNNNIDLVNKQDDYTYNSSIKKIQTIEKDINGHSDNLSRLVDDQPQTKYHMQHSQTSKHMESIVADTSLKKHYITKYNKVLSSTISDLNDSFFDNTDSMFNYMLNQYAQKCKNFKNCGGFVENSKMFISDAYFYSVYRIFTNYFILNPSDRNCEFKTLDTVQLFNLIKTPFSATKLNNLSNIKSIDYCGVFMIVYNEVIQFLNDQARILPKNGTLSDIVDADLKLDFDTCIPRRFDAAIVVLMLKTVQILDLDDYNTQKTIFETEEYFEAFKIIIFSYFAKLNNGFKLSNDIIAYLENIFFELEEHLNVFLGIVDDLMDLSYDIDNLYFGSDLSKYKTKIS